jgi:hypothetical protein
MDFTVAAEILHAHAGDLYEIADAARRQRLAGEFGIHDLAALGLAHRRLHARCRELAGPIDTTVEPPSGV